MQIIFRGNEVLFTATPLDEDGVAVVPSTITLYLNYVSATGRSGTSIVMDMQSTSGPWTAEWDTSAANPTAYPGIVYYSVRAVSPSASEDGEFELDANPANPGA